MRALMIPAFAAVFSASPDASFSTATSAGTPLPEAYSLRTRWPGPFGAIMKQSTPSGGSRRWR